MDVDKIKQFLIHHFEKMILVLIIAGAGYMVFQGLKLPNLLTKRDPESLGADATQVKADLDEDHNQAIIPDREPTFSIIEATGKINDPVPEPPYGSQYLWDGTIVGNSSVRRQDPTLLPPLELHVVTVVTTLAIRGTSDPDEYFLASLEDADPIEKVEPRKRPKRTRRSGARGPGGMGMGMGGEMGMEGMESMESMMGGPEMGARPGMGGMETTAVGGRKLDSKFDFGVRPGLTQDKRNPKPTIGWFVAGTALLPHKEIYEAYEFALKSADQYDPGKRDTPIYFNLEVQRAEVTKKPIDQLVDEDWRTIWNRMLYTKLAARLWSGFAPEIVHKDYRDDALTMWIPPVLLDDYRNFCTHPKIPTLSQKELEGLGMETEEVVVKQFGFDDDGDDTLVGPTGRVAPGRMGAGGRRAGGMQMGRGGIEKHPVDHKLLRFYDFIGFRNSPEIGKKYVYRIRYSVNDPNFPGDPLLQPRASILGPDVNQRVKQKMAAAVRDQKRDFQRWCEWSQPSAPVSLVSREQVFAGPVKPGTVNEWNVAGKKIQYAREIPKASLVASQFDPMIGTRLPMTIEVTEGSILSHKAETADVVDPITLKIKKLPEAELISGSTIVDLHGGRPLQIASGDGMTEPGLMLLFDATGKLQVHTELGSHEFYRIYSYAEERGE